MCKELKTIVAYTDGSDIAGHADHVGGTGSGIHAYGYNIPIGEQALAIYKQRKMPELLLDYAVVDELPECIGDREYKNLTKNNQEVKSISINDLDIMLMECYHPQLKATSQVGELIAFVNAIKCPIKATEEYIILTDSMYLKQGIEDWMEGWKKKGWTKSTGGPIGNVTIWKEIYSIVQDLKHRGIRLSIVKIKGHSDRFGNDEADRLAGKGSSTAVNLGADDGSTPSDYLPMWEIAPYEINDEVLESSGENEEDTSEEVEVVIKKPKKIKDEDKLLPLLLRQKYLYTIGGEEIPQFKIGGENLYRYYGGDHAKSKDDRLLLGKAYPDAIQYITFVSEKTPILDKLTEETHNRTWDNIPMMYRSNLVYLVNGTFLNQERFNQRFVYSDDMEDLVYNNLYNELYMDEKNWLTVAVRPPMLSLRAFDLADRFTDWFRDLVKSKYKSTPKMGVSDITDLFFEGDKAKPTNFYRAIDKACKLKAPIPGTDKTIDITTPRDIAIPNRTYLNKLAKHNLKMYLVTRRETNNAFRYYILLDSDLGKQMVASYYSSLRVYGVDS